MSLKREWISEKKQYKKKGGALVYKDQKKVAKKIIRSFRHNQLVTLCAPPQWGKTGVSLYVSYIMAKKRGIDPNNVFFITAMSDRSWIQQTKTRVLPLWKNNVYHRNTLHKMESRLQKLKEENKEKNILIIIDECHLANKKEHTLGKIFQTLKLNDESEMKRRNIKLLQISATPSNALYDAENWIHHGRICPRMGSGYVSFQTFLDEDRLREPYDLETDEGCRKYFGEVCMGKPKYHFVRSVSCGPYGKLIYSGTKGKIC